MADVTRSLQLARDAVDHLVDVASRVTAQDLGRQSYDDDWTVAQVFSHLGSGAEIFTLILEAGRTGAPAPGPAEFAPVWDSWNARSPEQQHADAVAANRAFIAAAAGLSPAEQADWSVDLFGMQRDLANVIDMRVSETAVHTWDVAVTLDPEATVVPEDVVGAVLDGLGQLAAFTGKPTTRPARVDVTTTAPRRELTLAVGEDRPALTAREGEGDASLLLPAEALVRLVYGRLDSDHTPELEVTGIELDVLRDAFPGL